MPENEEILHLLQRISEEQQIDVDNGVNAKETKKRDKLSLHLEDFMYEPLADPSPKSQNSCVVFYKFLSKEVYKNEDFNYHKYQLLKSHVKFFKRIFYEIFLTRIC